MSFTRRLLNHTWNQHVQAIRRDDDMRVKCLVAGSVKINDLNREFHYGQEEIVSLQDYQKSRELRNAISKGFIQLLDRYSSRNRNSQQLQQIPLEQQSKTSIEDVKELAKTMAKEMASEMVKEILEKMPKTQIVQQVQTSSSLTPDVQTKSKLKAVEIEEETFVRMNSSVKEEDDNAIKIDLSKQSNNKEVSDDSVKSSLAKIKALKKKKNV